MHRAALLPSAPRPPRAAAAAMLRRLLIASAGVALVAGCSSPPAPTIHMPTSTAASPTPSVPPPTITLAFAGDVHFTGKTAPLLDNPATAFGPVSEIFRAADFALVNLETAVTDGGSPQPKKYTFRAPPAQTWEAIKAAGLDAVSLGNNHVLDFGQTGLLDALRTAQAAGVGTFGSGVDADAAYGPWITTVQGVRIAFLAFSQVNELNTAWVATDTRPGVAIAITDEQVARVTEQVRAARELADVVVVFPHWGQETNSCPTELQRTTAQALADAGATLIVGAHAHVLQGAGWLGGTYVAYGLGNFVWYSSSSRSYDTGVLRVTLTGDTISDVEFLPAKIDFGTGQPIPVDGDEFTRIRTKFADLRSCTDLAEERS